MKKLILAVLLLMLSTPVWAAPDADHDADRAAAAFSVVTPATDDYWIFTDTSNFGRFAKVATSSVRAALGIGTSDNPTWNSGNFTGGNIAASNKQVTKAWFTGLQYTANVTSVIHRGRHYICTSTHTASAAGTGAGTNEPGVGDDWATVWTLGVLGDNTIYTQDTEPAGGTDGDIWVDTNGTTGQRLYTREESTWVAQAGGGGGYTNLTDFDTQTAWRIFYSNTDGDVTELALGADGEYLKSNGAAAAPTWATPSGAAHDALTLDTETATIFSLSTQQLTLDSQTANYFLVAPNGSAGDPTFRAMADADIPSAIARDTELPTAGSLSVDDLITLSGVATGAVNLGSFTGATIDDNLTVKAALQDFETSVEALLPVGTDGNYKLSLTNNAVAVSPTVASYELYSDVGVWKANQGGTEYTIPLSPLAGQVSFTGPTQARAYALPDAAATILTTNAAVTPAQGGTGVANGANNTVTFTGNYTLGLTLTGNTAVTLPTSGTLITGTSPQLTTPVIVDGSTLTFDESAADPDDADLALSATDGVFKIAAVNGANNEDLTVNLDSTANTAVVASSTGVTSVGFSAINLTTTGYIQGGVKVVTDANGMSESEMTTGGMYGTLFLATGAGTWTLPTAVEGMSGCLRDTGTNHDLILDVQAGDDFQLLGVEDANGDGVTNAATTTTGDMICFVATSAGHWMSMGIGGVWVAQ